jgi:hypothetical protein
LLKSAGLTDRLTAVEDIVAMNELGIKYDSEFARPFEIKTPLTPLGYEPGSVDDPLHDVNSCSMEELEAAASIFDKLKED